MKITFVDVDLSPRTGSRRFTYEVARQLQSLGHGVKILTTRIDREKCFSEYLSMPVEVICEKKLPGEVGSTSRFVGLKENALLEIANNFAYSLEQARLALRISEKIADSQCEVALFHYHGEHWLLPYFYHLRAPNGVVYLNVVPPMPRPFALPFQELTLEGRLMNRLLDLPPVGRWKKTSFSKLSMFITPSKFLLEQARRFGVIGLRKAAVVPLGVNHSEFYSTGEEEAFALYLGRIHPHKSLETVVLSMKNAPSNYSLVIAGDVEEQYLWYVDKLYRLAEKIGISDRFTVLPSPSDSEVVRLMQRCSVFLFPSTIDTFGLVVLEAMACGKPIVACNRGGVPELVGHAGFLVEPDVGQWQHAVGRLLSNSALRRKMGREAMERSKNFSWEHTTNKLLHAIH